MLFNTRTSTLKYILVAIYILAALINAVYVHQNYFYQTLQFVAMYYFVYSTEEHVEIVVDFGGRVEELVLVSQSKESGEPQKVLLSHNGNASAIKENMWWKGMFLVPWANRIAYVSYYDIRI